MSDDLSALYTGWTQAVADSFRALMPGAPFAPDLPPRPSAAAPAAPFPIEPIADMLGVFAGVLTQLYESYLPLLAQGRITTVPFEALTQNATNAFGAVMIMVQERIVSPVSLLRHSSHRPAVVRTGEPSAGQVKAL